MRLDYLVLAVGIAACGPPPRPTHEPVDGGATDAPADAPSSVFPTGPIIEGGAPMNAADLFGDPAVGAAGGPCVAEPATNSLIPAQFLRPRFRLVTTSGENLFELRITTPSVPNPLVVYTMNPTWTIPAAMWEAMSGQLAGATLSYAVRSARWAGTVLTGGPYRGSNGSFRIAPASAGGSIVYWTNGTGTTASFKGFDIGDETVTSVLTPPAIGNGVVCVGCHTSTPDGKFIGFSAVTDPVLGDQSHVEMRSIDGTLTTPTFITPSAAALLARAPNQQQPFYSPAHWQDGDHKVLAMFPVAGRPEIIWTDLEATSSAQGVGWGVIARTGDTGHAGAGTWSHDGNTIAYSSAPFITSGMNADNGNGDIYTVPYNGGAGGTATKLPGASEAAFTEHYAAFSADDKLLAFVRVAASQSAYNNSQTEVYVVPATGGVPTKLEANRPSECSTVISPGVANTWPKWSPAATTHNGITYYWLTFSTKRRGNVPQLYVAPITVDGAGAITTYPALYLWNQPANEHNHTPAWNQLDTPIGAPRPPAPAPTEGALP